MMGQNPHGRRDFVIHGGTFELAQAQDLEEGTPLLLRHLGHPQVIPGLFEDEREGVADVGGIGRGREDPATHPGERLRHETLPTGHPGLAEAGKEPQSADAVEDDLP